MGNHLKSSSEYPKTMFKRNRITAATTTEINPTAMEPKIPVS
jgi:hypothetical protein